MRSRNTQAALYIANINTRKYKKTTTATATIPHSATQSQLPFLFFTLQTKWDSSASSLLPALPPLSLIHKEVKTPLSSLLALSRRARCVQHPQAARRTLLAWFPLNLPNFAPGCTLKSATASASGPIEFLAGFSKGGRQFFLADVLLNSPATRWYYGFHSLPIRWMVSKATRRMFRGFYSVQRWYRLGRVWWVDGCCILPSY